MTARMRGMVAFGYARTFGERAISRASRWPYLVPESTGRRLSCSAARAASSGLYYATSGGARVCSASSAGAFWRMYPKSKSS